MESFCKTEDCPTSEVVAAIRDRGTESERVRIHLLACEFCAAELDLYRHYAPTEEKVEPATIPRPLFDLADALLHKRRDLTALYRLVETRD